MKKIRNRVQDDNEYYLLVNHILKNEEFKKIGKCVHHGTTRLDHCLRVSYYSYKIAKKLNFDYESTARGGLMHDFFYNENGGMTKDGIKSTFTHSKIAAKNSEKYFDINCKEKDIIEKHMFPININKVPRYKESIIVSLVDKAVAIFEFNKKFINNFLILSVIFTKF